MDTLQVKLERDTRNNRMDIIKEIQSCIAANLAKASQQFVADSVSLHPAYVSKLFKQVSGVSISEYILNMKMEQAVENLRNSDMKIYEISEQLGYANNQYFIKVFKEQFGMTPRIIGEIVRLQLPLHCAGSLLWRTGAFLLLNKALVNPYKL